MTEENHKTDIKPIWKRRWFRVLSIILVLFGSILIATPYFISYSLKNYLLENGADKVAIEDINFNPFTATAEVKGLDVRKGDRQVLSNSRVYLDISLLALLKKGVAVEAATIEKLVIDIEQTADGKLRIGSLLIDPDKAPNENLNEDIKEKIAWWLGLGKVTLNDSVIQFTSPDLTTRLFLDSISVQNMSTRPGSQTAKFDIKVRLNQSDISSSITLHELTPEVKADGDLSLQKLDLNDFSGLAADVLDRLSGLVNASGKFSIGVSKNNDVDVSYSGKTAILNTDLGNQEFSATGDELSWDGKLIFSDKSDSKQLQVKLDGTLNGSALAVSVPEILDTKGSKLAWKGKFDYASPGRSGDKASDNSTLQSIQLEGRLETGELTLNLIEQKLALQLQAMQLNPQLSLQLSESTTGLSGTATLSATGTRIDDAANALTLMAINKLDLRGVTASAMDQLKIDSVTLQGTSLIQSQKSEQPTLTIDDTVVSDINYSGQAVSINSIVLAKLAGSFVREKDGSIDIINELQGADKADSTPVEKVEAEKKDVQSDAVAVTAPSTDSFAIKIGETMIKDNSIIHFTDRAVSPEFKSALNIASLKLTDIDSSKPDQPIAIDLSSKLNNYAALSIKGSVKPFLSQPAIDLKARLENQNMVALSPYVISSTGYQIHSGQLNIDSSIVIQDGSIDAKNTLFMKKLKLEAADARLVKQHTGSIGMPLDKALGMLRDKNDNIKLDVPISGKLDEVNIGTGQIINLALKKATTAGMKTYLLYAFQPYGALIMVGQAVGKQAGKIHLDPIVFVAGNDTLSSKQKDYLEKLGKVMLDRPKIDVQICAYTVPADLSISKDSGKESKPLSQKQIEQSLKLGSLRQKLIKDHLISKFKIDNGRLVLCSPEYDDSKDAKPRVELLI